MKHITKSFVILILLFSSSLSFSCLEEVKNDGSECIDCSSTLAKFILFNACDFIQSGGYHNPSFGYVPSEKSQKFLARRNSVYLARRESFENALKGKTVIVREQNGKKFVLSKDLLTTNPSIFKKQRTSLYLHGGQSMEMIEQIHGPMKTKLD